MQTPQRSDPAGGGMLSSTPTPTRDNSTLLREQQAERERLLMDNFNQALRINYLEERLLRVKQGTDFAGEDLESEIAQLRITLEERDHELRQRNFSMIRATEAMDLLTAQLRAAQEAAARAREDAQQEAEAQLHQQLAEAERRRGGVDAETAEQWRVELENAVQKEHQSALRGRELETELARQQQEMATLTAQMQELLDARARDQHEMEARLQQEQQNAQQGEMASVKASAESEHWKTVSKQREEQLAAAQHQVESLQQEKQALDARYQNKMKRMEEQVQHQMEQLQRESEKYRMEHTRLLTEREKTQFDKERIVMENESNKQERARLQAEMQRLAGENERARLQNAKLSAACEEQAKSLESFKGDRESAMDTIHQLESEVLQWRKMGADHELTIKTLETRVQQAEAEARRMTERCEMAETRTQQTSNERLLALEQDRLAIEDDNRRLRVELANFQQDMESMEHKFQAYEERLASEAASAQEQREHILACEEELERRSVSAQDYQKQLAGCEDELARRAERLQELEKQLANVAVTSSMTDTAVRQQQTEWQNQFAMEKSELLQSLDNERRRTSEMQRTASGLEKESMSARQELKAVELELRSVLGSRTRSFSNEREKTMASLVRDAVSALKSDFKAEVAAIQTRWKQQAALTGSKLDRLSGQLHSSQGKLEVLQRSTFHAKDAKQSLEKSWSVRYEELRLEKENERRALEEEINYFQSKAAQSEDALAQVRSDVEALSHERKGSHAESGHDYEDLKESNRLLFEEVQERRRSAEHARKQYMRAVRENKGLLKAIETYKNGLSAREKDIEKYKAMVVKYTQQLQLRASYGEVKQTLLEQLEQTQYMISETYKRWEDSAIGRGAGSKGSATDQEESYEAAVIQLDEFVGRMQLVSERWGEFVTQSQELQRRYGDAWQSAASRGFDRTKEQPRWVDDVERKCTRLLTESVRVSEAMRDVVSNIARVLQRERDEKKRLEKERAMSVDNNATEKQLGIPSISKWSPLDSDFYDDRFGTPSSVNADQPRFESPVKTQSKDADPSCHSSKTTSSARRGVNNPLYRNSLSSLGRVGVKVQDMEKELRNARQ